MRDELTFEGVLGAIDRLLELQPRGCGTAGKLWSKLDQTLDELLDATEFDTAHHGRLAELTSPSKAAAARFLHSLLNLGKGYPTRDDWTRFAERDLVKLKDEVLAVRDFLVKEAGFFKFACLRAKLRTGEINPEKLFEELHEQGAISERAWILLMAQPNSWRKALKDRAVAEELKRISSWLLDLQEVKRTRRELAGLKKRKGEAELCAHDPTEDKEN